MGLAASWRSLGSSRVALLPDLAGCQSPVQADIAGSSLGDPATADDDADLYAVIWKISGD